MHNGLRLARVLYNLGIASVLRVALYRLRKRMGLLRTSPQHDLTSAQYFNPSRLPPSGEIPSSDWIDSAKHFGHFVEEFGACAPAWHSNPFTGRSADSASRVWSDIPDFDANVGDIKAIWEPSRFAWVPLNAHRAREGDQESLDRLNLWLADWVIANPPYNGPNWKCGQEASIRVLHLASAAIILGQHVQPGQELLRLVEEHLHRIVPTLSYAIGQNNNHGTSEAAALFVGGSWLARSGNPKGAKWERLGRRVMIERIGALVCPDGTFSQYSVSYQRMLLDTAVIVEAWRRALDIEQFPQSYLDRLGSATSWLRALVEGLGGEAPNIGANDGAWLLPLGQSPIEDYRPTVTAAAAAFGLARPWPNCRSAVTKTRLLGLPISTAPMADPASVLFADGGFCVLRSDDVTAFMRIPMFRFRPSQADALHVDVWSGRRPLFRDAGSFSYAADLPVHAYFAGTRSHNTIMFDHLDQMPLLGRFLFADWIRADEVTFSRSADRQCAGAGYRSRRGHRHHRSLRLAGRHLSISDKIDGFERSAILRWRLPDEPITVLGCRLEWASGALTISASMPISRLEIVTGSESRYYLERRPCQVLEVELSAAGTVTSDFAIGSHSDRAVA
jgi:hypothetical protein